MFMVWNLVRNAPLSKQLASKFDVDYKIYDRKAFTVYEDTSFYDYNGDLEFNEDAVMCGTNRTECSEVS